MFTFINRRVAKSISVAVVTLGFGLGLGYTHTGFAEVLHANDAVLPQQEQAAALTPESLGALLQSMNISVSKITDNGVVEYQLNVPAHGDNAAVTLVLSISPNKQYVNIWYVGGQFGQQNCPNQQTLLAMLEANKTICPAYIDIENNIVVMRLNVLNSNVTATELMEQLKAFYTSVEQTRTVCAITPTDNQPATNPFG
jgi:hypothetical protein